MLGQIYIRITETENRDSGTATFSLFVCLLGFKGASTAKVSLRPGYIFRVRQRTDQGENRGQFKSGGGQRTLQRTDSVSTRWNRGGSGSVTRGQSGPARSADPPDWAIRAAADRRPMSSTVKWVFICFFMQEHSCGWQGCDVLRVFLVSGR